MSQDEMVRQHHQFNGHESEQTLGDSEGQGRLACCSSWGCNELDTTWCLNNNWQLLLFFSTPLPCSAPSPPLVELQLKVKVQ